MSQLHILVKDYGREGFTVHGVTESDEIAQVWESAEGNCRHITVDTQASVDPTPITFAERI